MLPDEVAYHTALKPGSKTTGIPASVTISTRSPAPRASSSCPVRWASLCSWYETTRAVISTTSTTRRSEEHTSELQSRGHLVCRLLLQKKHTKLPPSQ